jgi:excisionase family DNA binding protein
MAKGNTARPILEDLSARYLLRVPEACQLAGWSRALGYQMAKKRKIPVVLVPGGKGVRIPREAFLQWIRDNTVGGTKA